MLRFLEAILFGAPLMVLSFAFWLAVVVCVCLVLAKVLPELRRVRIGFRVYRETVRARGPWSWRAIVN